jgi:hypothetical protein
MKTLLATMLILTLLTLIGCDKSTPGGPGAAPANANPPANASNNGMFGLSMSPDSVTLKQGEAKAFTATIKRNDTFHEDVKLQFTGMPEGASVDPSHPAIGQGDTEVKFTLKADGSAALGDFAVKVIGHPTHGVDSTNDLKITIEKK